MSILIIITNLLFPACKLCSWTSEEISQLPKPAVFQVCMVLVTWTLQLWRAVRFQSQNQSTPKVERSILQLDTGTDSLLKLFFSPAIGSILVPGLCEISDETISTIHSLGRSQDREKSYVVVHEEVCLQYNNYNSVVLQKGPSLGVPQFS